MMIQIRNQNPHKEKKCIRINEGKIKSFSILIPNYSTDNSLFKKIMATVYLAIIHMDK